MMAVLKKLMIKIINWFVLRSIDLKEFWIGHFIILAMT
jgi:hypothetical protein